MTGTTALTSSAELAAQLSSELESLVISTANNNENSNGKMNIEGVVVPSLQQFYRIGLLLFQFQQDSSSGNSVIHVNDSQDVVMAYQGLIDNIPESILQDMFGTLCDAMNTLLSSFQYGHDDNDISIAVQSVYGLFQSSKHLCQICYTKKWISTLVLVYDQIERVSLTTKPSSSSSSKEGNNEDAVKNTILACLSSLLLDGLFEKNISSKKSDDILSLSIEESLLEAIQAMEEQSVNCLHDLLIWQDQYKSEDRTLESCIRNLDMYQNSNEDDATDRLQQREYILSMLETARQHQGTDVVARTAAGSATSFERNNKLATNATKSSTSTMNELDRRIQHIKQILPHFGEGFIETALSLYHGNVETTIATLLDDPANYPTTLQLIEPTLPRRKKEYQLELEKDSKEAKQLVKDRIALEEQKEQERYKALLYVTSNQQEQEEERLHSRKNYQDNIYNDDYDDQYDEIDIRLGSTDDGFTTDGISEYEQIKLYNQLVKDEENEDSYWEQNRNLNRPNRNQNQEKKNHNDDDDDNDSDDGNGKQYLGPDKIKGGKIIGPDGKVVRKPGGAKKQRNNNNNNNNNQKGGRGGAGGRGSSSYRQQQQTRQKQGRGSAGKESAVNDGQSSSNTSNNQHSKPNSKPRTKPKSDNRVNRQRDRKQQKHGAFGVQD